MHSHQFYYIKRNNEIIDFLEGNRKSNLSICWIDFFKKCDIQIGDILINQSTKAIFHVEDLDLTDLGFYVKARLDSHKAHERKESSVNISPTFINNNEIKNEVNINITFDIVFDAVENSALSADDKLVLKGMLADIEQLKKTKKDKNTIWTKIQSALAWISDKTKIADVTLASVLMRYIAQVLT